MQRQCSSAWYVLQVRANREAAVADQLNSKGYRQYLPLYPAASLARTPSRPLFPGYVFCHFDPFASGSTANGSAVVTTYGVIRLVGNGRTPLPVADEEIDAIQRTLASKLSSEPWGVVDSGAVVEVTAGPLRGIRGKVVSSKGCDRLVITIELLQRSLAVTIDRHWISSIGASCELPSLMPPPISQPPAALGCV
jgi:transcription antitermination factor NusG